MHIYIYIYMYSEIWEEDVGEAVGCGLVRGGMKGRGQPFFRQVK
jgi:hypothetical protein